MAFKTMARTCFLAAFAAAVSLSLVCSIQDDNGNPVNPGNPTNPGNPGIVPPPSNAVGELSISVSAPPNGFFVGINDTVTLGFTVTITDSLGVETPGTGTSVTVTNANSSNLLRPATPIIAGIDGTGSVRLIGREAGVDTVMFVAGSAIAIAEVTVSRGTVKFVNAPSDGYYVNQNYAFTVEFLDSIGRPVPSREINLTITAGTSSTPFFVDARPTGGDGRTTFNVTAPDFTGTAIVEAIVRDSDPANTILAQNSMTVVFRTGPVRCLLLIGSPAVISTGDGEAEITVTAFDDENCAGRYVSDEIISFNIISGPGAGERLSAATARTGRDGTARVSLLAGTMPSGLNNQGVRVRASTYNTPNIVQSNAVWFTIAGPPHNVTYIRDTVADTTALKPTYGLNLTVLVADVYGNPVADGTRITFGTRARMLSDHSAAFVMVEREVETTGGRADNTIFYLRLDAGEAEVQVWIEIAGYPHPNRFESVWFTLPYPPLPEEDDDEEEDEPGNT